MSSLITEVQPTGDEGGTVVFELRLADGGAWFVYRARRVPTLYGGG